MPGPQRRTLVTPGYVTHDDFGSDGDDTLHAPIPYHKATALVVANASFAADKSMPQHVDIVFHSFIVDMVLAP